MSHIKVPQHCLMSLINIQQSIKPNNMWSDDQDKAKVKK